MGIIWAPINGGHNEVGGDWVLPQVLIPYVTKSSHHLVLPPVIKCQLKGLLLTKNQPKMVDCALGDVHPPWFSSRLHVVGKRYVVAPYVIPGQHHDEKDIDVEE